MLMLSAATFSQQQLATLNHNDSIAVFYGVSALQQAHAAAVSGDIITLSSGSFNATSISKSIIIRGAGMMVDTLSNSSPTIIVGNFNAKIADDTLNHLEIEGVYIPGTMNYDTILSPKFVKCYFGEINYVNNYQNRQLMKNAVFTNCIINNWRNFLSLSNQNTFAERNYAPGTSFINCILFDVNSTTSETFINCIAKIIFTRTKEKSISNSIVYDNTSPGSTSISWSNSTYCFNNIGIRINSEFGYGYFFQGNNHNLTEATSFESVFKTFQGEYTDGETFELQDSIVSTILGSDGTQVGIYGGSMPFDPYVRHPLVRRCNVASRSTADGKLAVDIEIVSE